jgi:transposase
VKDTPAGSSSKALTAEEAAQLVAALQSELVGVKTTVASLQETIANLAQENLLLKRRLFGNKTERSHTSEMQLALGDLLATEARLQKELDAAVYQAKKDAGGDAGGPGALSERAKPKGRRDLLASKLPRFVVEIRDEEMEAQGCRRIGFDDSAQLMYRRGGFVVLVKRVARYEVADRGTTTAVTVASPVTLFPRGLLHTSTVAHLMLEKFGLGVPHYRLERELAYQGVPLDRGTMSRYMEQAGNTLGATVVHAMWADAIANAQVISTDATGALIQPAKTAKDGRAEACKKGHFFTAVVDCDAVLFAYVEHHNSESVKQLFDGFRGYLQADASNVYDVLERGRPTDTDDGVTLVGCFAHLRRYFFEAAICRYPEGLQGLMRIRAVYAADDAVSRAPAAERPALRETHVRPLVTGFFEWARGARQNVEGRNLAAKALGYAANQEAELLRVLDDANLPLDNTRSERELRKIVVGRKAWMFYGSDTHAEAAAAIFSIIASCRLHRLDSFAYLDEVLRVLPHWPRHRYLELAPKHWPATRARLRPEELAAPLSSFEIPAELAPQPDHAPPAA